MKIYKSNYRDHWISPYKIIDLVFFWTDWSRCSRSTGIVEDKDYVDHPAWVDRVADYLDPVCTAILKILNFVHPQINYVKIDPWDTWSMDHTLADIILPMLKQLQATKHGAPFVDDEDVPENLRSAAAEPKENEWDTDSNHFLRWDWVLDEMIWAFEQKVDVNSDSQFFKFEEIEDLPKKQSNRTHWIEEFNERASRTKYDKEGHEAWQKRKANGLRLFGKYFEALWD